MTASQTILLIVLVALVSCVCISSARELMKPIEYVQECIGASCQPKLDQPNQFFGSCFKDSDCVNSCFESCSFQKCHHHQCDCKMC
ncbi:hypothetical protein N665_1038s0011 [Sinapis alba]|nr:hypothetical protein N665_1038s0011 [Sinapis alba]